MHHYQYQRSSLGASQSHHPCPSCSETDATASSRACSNSCDAPVTDAWRREVRGRSRRHSALRGGQFQRTIRHARPVIHHSQLDRHKHALPPQIPTSNTGVTAAHAQASRTTRPRGGRPAGPAAAPPTGQLRLTAYRPAPPPTGSPGRRSAWGRARANTTPRCLWGRRRVAVRVKVLGLGLWVRVRARGKGSALGVA